MSDSFMKKYPISVLPGDYPDPSIIRVGLDYYMTHSSFMYGPGLLIWHSRNLIDWNPVVRALRSYIGDIWAPELVYVNERYYIYFPANGTNYVIFADQAEGPWSDPIDLNVDGIDPGHLITNEGQRYLYVNYGRMVPLAPDGLSAEGELITIYNGWQIPENWDVEGQALESPKLFARGNYYYMVSAQGGTAGPATSHMAIVARSESPEGPWENSPYNPLVHTWSKKERWWSKGHGTIVDTPDGEWYIFYHAYEKDYITLGRQTLMEPVEWAKDDWPILPGGETVQCLSNRVCSGLSDDFSNGELGWQWQFYKELNTERFKVGSGVLKLKAKGESAADSSPIVCIPTDHAYEAEIKIQIEPGVEAGIIVFYNDKSYAGIGFTEGEIFRLRRGIRSANITGAGSLLYLKLQNDHNTIRTFYSLDGQHWTKFPFSMDVSGYHHNTFGEFLSLRLALYAAGSGTAEFSHFSYHKIK